MRLSRRTFNRGLAATLGGTRSALAGFTLPPDRPGNRSPYLQNNLGTSLTVCWSTSGRVPTQLQFRALPSGSAVTLRQSEPRRLHQAELTDLTPGATYQYRVREEQGWTGWKRVRTAPAEPRPFRFAVFGDFGSGTSAQQTVVRLLEREVPDFALCVGDLAYPLGSHALLSQRYYKPLASYTARRVVWPVWGNHDVAAEDGQPLDASSATPRNGPPGLPDHRNYSFRYGNAHFAVIDSNLSSSDLTEHVAPWLEADLTTSEQPWKFVFSHHPPHSVGEHGDSRALQALISPVLERTGVTAMFSGHDHLYERFRPIRGVTYFVTGTGGAALYQVEDQDPRLAYVNNRRHGLTLVDVSPSEVHVRHFSESRRALDHVTLTV